MTWPWRLIGPLFMFLGVAFPVLIVTQDRHSLDTTDFVVSGGMALFGLWQFLYLHKYAVTLDAEGFVLQGLHPARRVVWREVARVDVNEKGAQFALVDGQIVKVSRHFSHFGELLACAETKLPSVAWRQATSLVRTGARR